MKYSDYKGMISLHSAYILIQPMLLVFLVLSSIPIMRNKDVSRETLSLDELVDGCGYQHLVFNDLWAKPPEKLSPHC